MIKQPLIAWYEAAAAVTCQQQGKRVLEVVCEGAVIAGDGRRTTDFWKEKIGSVQSFLIDRDGCDEERLSGEVEGPIDLLYLDAWPIGAREYKQRHVEAYRVVRDKLHPKSLILVGDTGRDHGGKAGLVLPAALDDRFRVLSWGPMTLLAAFDTAEVRGILPRLGPPVPGEASFDDAVQVHRQGLHWEAEQLYRVILKDWPDHVGALHLLGVVRHQCGDHEEALRLIGRAIALDPSLAVHFSNYGAALQALGRSVEAMACFHRALAIRPRYMDALSNLGVAQEALGQEEAAITSFKAALELKPDHADALKRLTGLLQRRGQEAEAVRLFEQALQKNPTAELSINLGNLYLTASRLDLALPNYDKAIELESTNASAHFNRGAGRQQLHLVDEAREDFKRAAELRPDRPLWRLRSEIMGPAVFQSSEEIDAFRSRVENVLDTWCAGPRPRASWNDLLGSDAIPNLSYAYHACNNRRLKEKFAAFYAPYFGAVPEPKGSGVRSRQRIGVLVTQRHEGIFLRCMRGVLEDLDPQAFELVILCSNGISETLKKGIHRENLRFVTFSANLSEAAARIRDTACDLIHYWEVGSDSLNYFLPYMRLAPVQTTSWGSQITTGLKAIDFFMSSQLLEEEGSEEQYTERLWRSKTLFSKERRLPPVCPVSREYFHLPDGRNLYVCFQNPLKLHPDMDGLVRGILEGDPRALLVLLAGAYPTTAARLRERFAKTIPGSEDRIAWIPWLKFDDYCRLLQLADVVLDPPHYTAGSTAYDLFSCDQPIVTMPGRLAVGRMTAAFYRQMGMADLIADSPAAYVSAALRLGTDRDWRMDLRARVHAASSAIFDDRDVAGEHERFFAEALRGSAR